MTPTEPEPHDLREQEDTLMAAIKWWTSARLDALRQLAAEGLTSPVIARRLTRRYHRRVTPTAVQCAAKRANIHTGPRDAPGIRRVRVLGALLILFAAASGAVADDGGRAVLLRRPPDGPTPLGGVATFADRVFPLRGANSETTVWAALSAAHLDGIRALNRPQQGLAVTNEGRTLVGRLDRLMVILAHARRGPLFARHQTAAADRLAAIRRADGGPEDVARRWRGVVSSQRLHADARAAAGRPHRDSRGVTATAAAAPGGPVIVIGRIVRSCGEVGNPLHWARLAVSAASGGGSVCLLGGSAGATLPRPGNAIVGGLWVGDWDPDADGPAPSMPILLVVALAR